MGGSLQSSLKGLILSYEAAMVVLFPPFPPPVVPPAFQTGIEVQWERAQG